MKLYHFNPNDYGTEYFVTAQNKIQAHKYLLEHLKKLSIKHKYYVEYLELWSKVNPLDVKTFPEKYTLDEHDAGSVILSEIC